MRVMLELTEVYHCIGSYEEEHSYWEMSDAETQLLCEDQGQREVLTGNMQRPGVTLDVCPKACTILDQGDAVGGRGRAKSLPPAS